MTESHKKKYDNAAMALVTGIRDLFKTREVCGELKETDRLDGKTVFIDGASSGLGFAIAVDVAKRGARVIMACRSGIPEKGEKVKKISGNQDIHMLHVNLSDLSSIQHLTSNIQHLTSPPDIYILNAGIVPKKSRKTPQGLEEMFTVNYFAKFSFIKLLIDKRLILDPGSLILDNLHPTSNIQHPTSNIQHPTSNIEHRAPSTGHRASSIQNRFRDIRIPPQSGKVRLGGIREVQGLWHQAVDGVIWILQAAAGDFCPGALPPAQSG